LPLRRPQQTGSSTSAGQDAALPLSAMNELRVPAAVEKTRPIGHRGHVQVWPGRPRGPAPTVSPSERPDEGERVRRPARPMFPPKPQVGRRRLFPAPTVASPSILAGLARERVGFSRTLPPRRDTCQKRSGWTSPAPAPSQLPSPNCCRRSAPAPAPLGFGAAPPPPSSDCSEILGADLKALEERPDRGPRKVLPSPRVLPPPCPQGTAAWGPPVEPPLPNPASLAPTERCAAAGLGRGPARPDPLAEGEQRAARPWVERDRGCRPAMVHRPIRGACAFLPASCRLSRPWDS